MADRISNSVAALDAAHHLHGFSDLSAVTENSLSVIDRGEGVFVYDDGGNRYIDCTAGMFATALGFSEKELAEAAYRQMLRLPTYHTLFETTSPPAAALVDKIVEITPDNINRVFLVNSGSEANDTIVKLVWYRNNALGLPEKKKIISRRGSYHGNTVAASSLTGMERMHEGFDTPIDRFLKVDGPHMFRAMQQEDTEADYAARLLEQLETMIQKEGPDTIAAMFVDPVSASGGMQISPEGYFQGLQEILKQHDILLVVDEVISGFGRTGNMFACETFGLKPDVMSMAKGLCSAYLPIAAIAMSDAFFDGVAAQASRVGMFRQAFTTSGHPTASAVALRNIELIEERDLVGHVRRVAPLFQSALRELETHELVGNAHGIGLAGAVELVADKSDMRPFGAETLGELRLLMRRFGQRHGVIPRGMADIQTFTPPLIITEDEIAEMFAGFRRALDDLAGHLEATGARHA